MGMWCRCRTSSATAVVVHLQVIDEGNLRVARDASHVKGLLDGGASVKLHIGDHSNGIADWLLPVVPDYDSN